MGRFFTSFDEAWEFFLGRDDELEDFFARLPDEESFLLGWLIRLDPGLRRAARASQRAFSHLDWVTPVPEDFLHISIAGVAFGGRPPAPRAIEAVVARAERAWRDVGPFEIAYPRLACFHDAIVAEVAGEGPRALVERLVESGHWDDLPLAGAWPAAQLDTYLPHVTLGVFNRPHDAAPLRGALTPVRHRGLGSQVVDEATLCLVRLSRTPVLPPWDWEVVGSVALG